MPFEPTRSGGYTFSGWYTDRNGQGTQFYSSTPVTGDITVYAWWTPYSSFYYVVLFDADGGNPSTQTRTIGSGSSVGYGNMPSEPTRSGEYTFGGWYTDRNGGGTQFN
jgi:uncharacterized repeat protein (TIGR02543 family)